MINLSNVSLQFGGRYLFKNVNYRINAGNKISLVGVNGAGKSSFLKLLIGELLPESGKIIRQKGINIGYLPQDNIIHAGKTLFEEAKSSLNTIINLEQKEFEITNKLSQNNIHEEEQNDLINQLGEIHHRLEELDSYSTESKIEKILTGLGFEKNNFFRLTDEFSGGWQMRIALSKILISQNDLLLLDEPTNHLDIDSLKWLLDFLKDYKGALLVVSHDKHFVNQVTNKTLEIYNGGFNTFNGDYDAYLKFKKERDIQTANLYEQQQNKINETKRFIEKYRYKATKAKQAQSRIKKLEKINLIELPDNKTKINIKFPESPQSGKVNIELISISKSFGEKVVFDNISFRVDRGDKIAFVGPNGAGKTTFAKIIAGKIDFDKGERITGYNTIISYYAQDVADNLDPGINMMETIDEISNEKTPGQLRSLLGSFLFSTDDVFKKVSVLSGGEKSRLALAKMLLTKANFIILDEPTNHLDISSKEVLQRALIDFRGSIILVSHYVDFLKPIVNKVVEIREKQITVYSGGIEYFLSKRSEQNTVDNKKNTKKKGSSEILTRKDKKRIEAELRQQKYDATKKLTGKIEQMEKEIEKHETREKELENLLTNPDIYEDVQKAKEITNEYKKIKEKLESILQEWNKLSDELSNIESEFT